MVEMHIAIEQSGAHVFDVFGHLMQFVVCHALAKYCCCSTKTHEEGVACECFHNYINVVSSMTDFSYL